MEIEIIGVSKDGKIQIIKYDHTLTLDISGKRIAFLVNDIFVLRELVNKICREMLSG